MGKEFASVTQPDERSYCRHCGVPIGRYLKLGGAITGHWWHDDSGFDDRCATTTAEPIDASTLDAVTKEDT